SLGGEPGPQAFRSTAWGEQVIIYVDPHAPANRLRIPGVSHGSPGCLRGCVRRSLTAMDATARPAASALLARLASELHLDRRLLPVADDAESVPLPSAMAVGELAWCSVAVPGAALSSDGGLAPDPQQIAAAYRSDRYLLIDGEHPDPWSPLSRFWPTAAGWIRTHGNYPHHAAALRSGLGLAGDAGADDIARALSALKADTAAARIRTAGGVAVEVRRERPEEDAALRRHPLVDITRVGDAARRPL